MRPARRFVPDVTGHELERRLPPCGLAPHSADLVSAAYDDGTADPYAADEVAYATDDPFEHSFADPEDHVPDGPNPPHSQPGFPPD
jgi:hypothetical protein